MTYSAAIKNSSRVAERPRLSSTGLRNLPARLSREKFCMLRAPIWTTSAHSATSSRLSLSMASVTMRRPKRSRISALMRVRGCAGLIGAAAEELRAGGGHIFGNGEGLIAALYGTRPGYHGKVAASDGGVRANSRAGEADDGVFFLDIAAG